MTHRLLNLTLHRTEDMRESEFEAIRRLYATVYPPEEDDSWGGHKLEWMPAPWHVVAWGNDGRALVHVGASPRPGRVGDLPVKLGGIGGVMVHPDARGRRLAAAAIARVRMLFAQEGVDFGLLFCEPRLYPFYEGLGWKRYDDGVMVVQRGERVPFTFLSPMVHAVSGKPPAAGIIDLLGPPW